MVPRPKRTGSFSCAFAEFEVRSKTARILANHSLPPTLKYEPGRVVAEGDFVIVHGRYSGALPTNWIVADILRIKDGVFLEHWDVIQDEANKAESKSGLPIFGEKFTK